MKATILFAVLLFGAVFGDLYMQNPRGTNNRLNEANTDATDQQRLFNSQNNAKGGYCWGPNMYFFEGSQLTIEWTAQHGCGSPKLVCMMIIQYMCQPADAPDNLKIRDGRTTNEITNDPAASSVKNAAGDLLYGMHENYDWYNACQTRQANMGLYVGDRVTVGALPQGAARKATYSRQSNAATRYGYECTEERDYYPYWVPSPWRDVAILTDNTDMCGYYQAESQNVKSRFWCVPATGPENNMADCVANGKTWTEVPAWGIAAPDCTSNPAGRDNHLGNGANGYTLNYNWTIPHLEAALSNNNDCVLRLRYNISSTEIGFNVDYSANSAPLLTNNPTYSLNDVAPADGTDSAAVAGNFNLTAKFAINTSQFARTFQDRSQTFSIMTRPSNIPANARIYNLNVRGKRGNIVQTYPGTEYDFVPNDLTIRVGDYIHFQWTGCDTNPAGNAGEGTDQTDRSNMAQVPNLGSVVPCKESQFSDPTSGCVPALFDTADLRAYFILVNQNSCLSYTQLLANANGNANAADAAVGNCFKLNNGEPYFDAGAIQMNKSGTFYYMNTRNNNFSNRGQKGVINVDPILPTWAIVIVSVAAFATVSSGAVGAAMFYAKSHPHSMLAEKLASFEK
jgi:hypothetical protein